MIVFNKTPQIKKSEEYVIESIRSGQISGDNKFTKLCQDHLEKNLALNKVLLTTSCTSAIEMAAMLLDIKEGDEIIMPSFTFVSSANPFVLFKGKIVFVDIKLSTLNIDENKIEAAITSKTKAILVVHYNGVACNMNKIMEIAKKYQLAVIEDAAQAIYAKYQGKYLGSFGDFGCFSFHQTKNFTMGEGGALVINNSKYIEKAKLIWEKGTDRSKYLLGLVDKYTWVSEGSSFLPSDILAANLLGQLEVSSEIISDRKKSWLLYYELLNDLSEYFRVSDLKYFTDFNAHSFYLLVNDISIRDKLINYLKEVKIIASFHYLPLHKSLAGKEFGSFNGDDSNTLFASDAIVRLPLYYQIPENDVREVAKAVRSFFNK